MVSVNQCNATNLHAPCLALSYDVNRQAKPAEDTSQQNSELNESWESPSEDDLPVYSTSPPYNSRQNKRKSGKHQKSSQSRGSGRSPNKGKALSATALKGSNGNLYEISRL